MSVPTRPGEREAVAAPATGGGRRHGRAEWAVFAAAAVAYFALALYLTRGTTLYVDEVNLFESSHGFEPRSLLAPLNGHLLAVPRAMYAASFGLFGASYLPLRIIEFTGVVLVAGLFFAFARRRIGPAALAPALVLLFFGSSWETTLSPIGIPNVWAIAAGLGALNLLDRDDLRGDVGACILLVLAVATHSVAIAFVVAVAVWVLLRPGRWRRAWIFGVPLVLYGAWLIAKPSLETSLAGLDTGVELSRISDLPDFVANSAAAVGAALTGLNFDATYGVFPSNSDPLWGAIVAAIAAIALAFRLSRGNVHPSLWAAMALLLTLWLSYDLLAFISSRSAEQGRYLLAGAIAVLIVAVEAARGTRIPRAAVVAIFAVAALSLGFNIAHLFDGGRFLRTFSENARAQFTAVELSRDSLAPDFSPTTGVSPFLSINTGAYLAAVDRIGSFAFTPAELQEQDSLLREKADIALVSDLGISVAPAARGATGADCAPVPASTVDQRARFPVQAPGAVIRSAAPAKVLLRRFGDQAAGVAGTLPAGRPALLAIPADRFPEPWTAVVGPMTGSITVCEIEGATGSAVAP